MYQVILIIDNILCTVPGGPPLSVTLSSPNSTSIAVRWQLPDPSVRNGFITKHQLNYTEVSAQPLNWTIVSLDGDTSYVIEDLKIFTRYYVSVSAGTMIVGYGPFSDSVMIRTLNDSKLLLFHVHRYNSSTVVEKLS